MRMQIPEDKEKAKEGLVKTIRTFLSVLHLDKHSGKDKGAQHAQKVAAFTQVTAHLNNVYGRLTGKC
jgi:hypothetical protein